MERASGVGVRNHRAYLYARVTDQTWSYTDTDLAAFAAWLRVHGLDGHDDV